MTATAETTTATDTATATQNRTVAGEFSTQIDALFTEWDRTDSPGAAVTVLRRGEVIHQRGYGMANLDHGIPLAADSVFHVASVSKQFCAIAVALLADEGKLALDDDIRTHVPEMPDLGHTITIRHCIHHTSGLRDQYGLFSLAGWRDDDTQTYDDVLDFAYRHERLNFPPGDAYRYCNTSYTLLAEIVKRVSGQSFREFVQERLLTPAEMTSSHFHDDHTAIVPRRTSAYKKRPEGQTGFKVANSTVSAVGAICLFTTAEDLSNWVRNYSAQTVAGAVLDDAMTAGTLNNGRSQHYGYGFFLNTYRGQRWVGHSGGDSGYRLQVTWFPDTDLGVIVLSNTTAIESGKMALRIADIAIADVLGPDELADAPTIEISAEERAALIGVYHNPATQQIREIIEKDGKLLMPDGFGQDDELFPIGHRRFRAEDHPSFEVRLTGPDDALELHETDNHGDVRSYTRLPQYTPELETLAALVGSYACHDLNATYSVTLKDGVLGVGERKNGPRKLRPLAKDLFEIEGPGGNTITVTHDAYGQVKDIQLFNERIRYLRFVRL